MKDIEGGQLRLRCERPQAVALVAAAILIYTLFVYMDVFAASWRFDDGAHLEFVTRYEPWQYFLIPAVTRAQSGIHVTPWNALFYDLGLALAGDQPVAHYAHLLIVLAASATTAFALLCRSVGVAAGLTAGLTFISGFPTCIVAHELMSGHYAYGLLFIGLATFAFVRYLRDRSPLALWLGAGFYLCACACKEIFTPLPAILFFLGDRRLRERFSAMLPFTIVALFYLSWRLTVLGNVSAAYASVPVAPADRAAELASFVSILFYSGATLFVASLILVGAMIVALTALISARGLRGAGLIVVSFAAAVLPLWVLTGRSLLDTPSRYLLLPWFGMSIMLGYAVGMLKLSWKARLAAALAVIGGAASLSIAHQQRGEGPDPLLLQAIYTGVTTLGDDEFILLPAEANILQISGLARKFCLAQERLTGKYCRTSMFLASQDGLERALSDGGTVHTYDPSCGCLENPPVDALRRRAAELDQMRCQISHDGIASSRRLSVEVRLREGHLHWSLGPYTKGRYRVYMDGLPIPHEVPPTGRSPFPPRTLNVQVSYLSPAGWKAVSPELTLDPLQVSGVSWMGPGIAADFCPGERGGQVMTSPP